MKLKKVWSKDADGNDVFDAEAFEYNLTMLRQQVNQTVEGYIFAMEGRTEGEKTIAKLRDA